MKAESSSPPVAPFEIEYNTPDTADIIFFDNVRQIEEETEEGTATRYTFDTYRMRVRRRATLIPMLESNFEAWLEAAKAAEHSELAAAIREKRNALLAASDSRLCLDRLISTVPTGTSFTAWLSFLKQLGAAISGEWAIYRKALRDITEQPGFPYDVAFPAPPED